MQPNTTQAAWQAEPSVEIAAYLPLKAFYYSHGDFIDEQGPDDSWEDPVLVAPGLESSGEPRLVHSSQPSLQVGSSGFDGICVLQAAVEDLPKALHWLLCDRWYLVFSQPEVELVRELALFRTSDQDIEQTHTNHIQAGCCSIHILVVRKSMFQAFTD